MPKVAITCSGDPFFLLDDSTFYLTRMKGEIHRYLMGNCEPEFTIIYPEK